MFLLCRRYTRNLVDEGNGKFNVIVLCWGEGQGRLAVLLSIYAVVFERALFHILIFLHLK